jgi:dihydropteroate synthase
VVGEVVGELADRLAALERDGVDPRQLVVDPGLGFAKNGDHNWALLAGLDRLRSLGRPVLVGASRKGFLGKLLADDSGQPRAMSARDDASAAVTALAAAAGAWAVRVHEVAASRDAVRVAAALRAARGPG